MATVLTNILAELSDLFFSSLDELGHFEPVQAEALPDEHQSLLAHHDHMTVTLEAWHNSLVDVRVLEEKREKDLYARNILLALQRDGSVVQFGIMHINLAGLPDIVRLEIESQALPLGRIMIRHHLLREVELCQLWRVIPGPRLQFHLKVEEDLPLYARTARILLKGNPVVMLLEIVNT